MDSEKKEEKRTPIKRLRGITIKAHMAEDGLQNALVDAARVTMLGFQPETALLDVKKSYLKALRSLEFNGFYKPLGHYFLSKKIKEVTKEDFDPLNCSALCVTNHLSAGWLEISFHYATKEFAVPIKLKLHNASGSTNFLDEKIREHNGIDGAKIALMPKVGSALH